MQVNKLFKTLSSNNVSTSIIECSSRTFIWVVTPLGFLYKKMNSLQYATQTVPLECTHQELSFELLAPLGFIWLFRIWMTSGYTSSPLQLLQWGVKVSSQTLMILSFNTAPTNCSCSLFMTPLFWPYWSPWVCSLTSGLPLVRHWHLNFTEVG